MTRYQLSMNRSADSLYKGVLIGHDWDCARAGHDWDCARAGHDWD